MFAHSVKEESSHGEVDAEARASTASVIIDASQIEKGTLVGSETSPARALQDRLKQSLEAPVEMSSRRVFATFLAVCISCWVAGIGLYALL